MCSLFIYCTHLHKQVTIQLIFLSKIPYIGRGAIQQSFYRLEEYVFPQRRQNKSSMSPQFIFYASTKSGSVFGAPIDGAAW